MAKDTALKINYIQRRNDVTMNARHFERIRNQHVDNAVQAVRSFNSGTHLFDGKDSPHASSANFMVNMMVTSSKADNASVTLSSHFKDCQRILKSVTQPYPVTMLELAEVLEMGPEGRYR